MDPSGPWSYAYNRLIPSGIASSASNDFQHQALSVGQSMAGQTSTAASILLQAAHASGASAFNPGALITPTPVAAYESVFNPIFHHATPKPAHFNSVINSQHRQSLSAAATENIQIKTENTRQTYEQPNTGNFYSEQSSNTTSPVAANTVTPTNLTWQQNSVNHALSNAFANYSNSQFAAAQAQSISQLKAESNVRSVSPQVATKSVQQQQSVPSPVSASPTGNNQYYRQQQIASSSYGDGGTQSSSNVYTNSTTIQKERRPRKPQSTTYHPQNLSQSSSTSDKATQRSTQTVHLVQSKSAETKNTYPQFLIIEQQEQSKQAEPETHQSSNEQESSNQIGYYAIVDGRLVYTTPDNAAASGNTSSHMQTPGHLYLTNSGELIIAADNAIKNEPIQKQSSIQSSPSVSAASAYSVYNNSVEAQQQQQQQQNVHYGSDSAGNVVLYKTNTPSRNASIINQTNAAGSVAYSSVITRATGDQAKQHSPHQQQQQQQQQHRNIQQQNTTQAHQSNWWENEEESYGALHDLTKSDAQVRTENILVTTDRPLASQVQLMQRVENQNQQITAQAQSSLNSTAQQQQVSKAAPKPKKPRKPRKTKAEKAKEEMEAEEAESTNIQMHCAQQQQQQQQQQQNGYFDFDNRWSVQQQPGQKSFLTNTMSSQSAAGQNQNFNNSSNTATSSNTNTNNQGHSQQQIWPNQSVPHHPSQIPYFNPLQMAAASALHSSHFNSINQGTLAQQLTNHYPGLNTDINTLQSTTTQQNVTTSPQQQTPPQQPEVKANDPSNKVVVPNIEEELSFLSDPNSIVCKTSDATKQQEPLPAKPIVSPGTVSNDIKNKPSSSFGQKTNAGFMSSYLRFLQGDRDTSPPPTGRAKPKPNYSRATTPNSPSNNNKTAGPQSSSTAGTNSNSGKSNSIQIQSQQVIIPPNQQQSQSSTLQSDNKQAAQATDNQNKRRTSESQFSSSDDGGGGGGGVDNLLKPQLPKKARPQMAMQMASMQSNSNRNQSLTSTATTNRPQAATGALHHRYNRQQVEDEDPLYVIPRRETSLRRAKTRGIQEIMNKSKYENDEIEEPQEFADSDTDPVWTPEDDDSDDGIPSRSTRRKKLKLFSGNRTNKFNNSNNTLSGL